MMAMAARASRMKLQESSKQMICTACSKPNLGPSLTCIVVVCDLDTQDGCLCDSIFPGRRAEDKDN